MDTESFLSPIISLLAAHSGTLIVFAMAPIMASLILEGIVHALRRRGLKPLLFAGALFAATVGAGVIVREIGLSGMASSPTFPQDVTALDRNATWYLTFAIPLGLLAASIRIVRSLFQQR